MSLRMKSKQDYISNIHASQFEINEDKITLYL
jgi:hypothetical protein